MYLAGMGPCDDPLTVGIDVGSHSVRAGVFTFSGKMLNYAAHEINSYSPKLGYYQQSSKEIWNAVCVAVKNLLDAPGFSSNRARVRGIGFDATCSMAIIPHEKAEVFDLNTLSTVSEVENDFVQDIIMWMDHRATEEADAINKHSSSEKTLTYVGKHISPEMQTPKLIWLTKHVNQAQWQRIEHLFDLPDYLTWKATGKEARNLCSLVCKWGLLPNAESFAWDSAFVEDVLQLKPEDMQKICDTFQDPGKFLGELSVNAKAQMGFPEDSCIRVGSGIIDAHAGCLGSISARLNIEGRPDMPISISRRLVMVCGTSSCHLTVSPEPSFPTGVWGPYKSVVLPGFWTLEGGQSASGVLLMHVLSTHPAFSDVQLKAQELGLSPQKYLEDVLDCEAKSRSVPGHELTTHLHVYPDFHGNRAPHADPSMKGMICGLTLSSSEVDLARLYLAAVQALAYSTKSIVEAMILGGHDSFDTVVMCGGLTQGSLFIQTHADVLGVPVIVPGWCEVNFSPVLLGAAMLGARASDPVKELQTVMRDMAPEAKVFHPNFDSQTFHERKYSVFSEMYKNQILYRNIMKNEE
ncbi:unnamed protein product [Notodromas monacha]|uniref:FGGY carbohydrate kinase domain-containing protein n=1 Tax=Notodromas monacha TaxID=399045 RepID=A0A7R9BVZ5_9CRUS|nr:unnamed protein product [Notodromas monacha]CAG0921253.1 unnamed protein product [Notodromas monacha]